MRIKTLPWNQYLREHEAIHQNLSKGYVDAYLLTRRGRKFQYLISLNQYLATQRRLLLLEAFDEIRQSRKKRVDPIDAFQEEDHDS